MGAAVALTTVINGQYPADGLVLIAAAASLWVEDELLEAAEKDPAAAGWEMTQRMFAKSAPPIQVKTTYDFLMKLDPRVMIGDLEASRAFDARGRLAGVAVPALVVVGAEDQLTTPEDARDLADRLPHARLEVVEAAGHMIIVEKPRIVGRLIAEFAAGLLI
jgi:pimeloyl-ACP methyl ester carboxylesterase